MDDKIMWLAIQIAKYKRWPSLPLAEIAALIYLHKAHRWNPAKSNWRSFFSTYLLSFMQQYRRGIRSEETMEQPRYLNFWLLRAEMKREIAKEKAKVEQQDIAYFRKNLMTPLNFPKEFPKG